MLLLATTALDTELALNVIKMVAIVGALLGVAWRLSSQLEKMRNQIETQTTLFAVKLELVEKQIEGANLLVGERIDRISSDLKKVKTDVTNTGEARAKLWQEINCLRERAKGLETKLE